MIGLPHPTKNFLFRLELLNILNQISEELTQRMLIQTLPSPAMSITIGPILVLRNTHNQTSEVQTQRMHTQIQPSLATFIMTGLTLEPKDMSTPTSPKPNSTTWVSNSSKPTSIHNQISEVPTQRTPIQIPLSHLTFTTTGPTSKLKNTHNQTSEVPTQEMHTPTPLSQATSVTIGLPHPTNLVLDGHE